LISFLLQAGKGSIRIFGLALFFSSRRSQSGTLGEGSEEVPMHKARLVQGRGRRGNPLQQNNTRTLQVGRGNHEIGGAGSGNSFGSSLNLIIERDFSNIKLVFNWLLG
jgi:hypothetical protein